MARTKPKPVNTTPAPITGANTYKVYWGDTLKCAVQADDMPIVMGYCADNKISWNAIKRID